MNTPIFRQLHKTAEERCVNFHFPGHKSMEPIPFGKSLYELDTTEMYGTDNLQNPEGVLRESLDMLSEIYGAKAAMFSVNGTTGGIHIAMATMTNPGDKVLIARNSHQSVYNGAILCGLEVSYIYPDFDPVESVTMGVTYESVEEAIRQNPDATCVILLNPNFFGVSSDLERIAELVHNKGMALMIDEAHGSHLNFRVDDLPRSALECGADIVVDSIHKTLPGLTQTSLILVGSDRVDQEKMMEMMRIMQTSSPSYLFMCSAEVASAYMADEKGRRKFSDYTKAVKAFRKKTNDLPGVRVYDTEKFPLDYTKIVLRVHGLSGVELSDGLYREHGIIVEMADTNYVLAVTSVMNTEEDLEAFYRAVKAISEKHAEDPDVFVSLKGEFAKSSGVMSPRSAFFSPKESCSLKDAVGRISASMITPYPPGIPLIVQGERIERDVVDRMYAMREKGLKIVGWDGGDIKVLERKL